MDCQLIATGKTHAEQYEFICSACKQPKWSKYSDPRLIHRPCQVPRIIKPPSVVKRVSSYAKAQARWIAAGSPVRMPDEIAGIFAICEACEHYKPYADGKGHCKLCGCRLKREGGLMNKIRMATETCPIEKW